MIRSIGQTLFPIVAACLLAVVSVVSAATMAPDRDQLERALTIKLLGVTAADLCGDDTLGHAGHCPFCNHLSQAPRPKTPDWHRGLALGTWISLPGDLVIGPQHLGPHLLARGPPHIG